MAFDMAFISPHLIKYYLEILIENMFSGPFQTHSPRSLCYDVNITCITFGMHYLSYPFQVSEDVPITMLFPAVGNQHHYEPRSYDYPENVDEETEVGNNEITVSPNNRKDIF